jgi:hypothetical protein
MSRLRLTADFSSIQFVSPGQGTICASAYRCIATALVLHR